MQLPTRGGHGRGWSRRRGRGRVTVQPTEISGKASDSDPRNKQYEDTEADRQKTHIYGTVDDEAETQKTPVCGQLDDGCVGSHEDVLWSQSRTFELKTYCDEDTNEYVVKPRVCLPDPNLNGNDEKWGQNHKELKPSTSVEYVDAAKYRARASSSSSSTEFSEEFFDAVECQPVSAPFGSFNVISPTATLYSSLKASALELVPKPPTDAVAIEWQVEPSFFA